MESQPLSWVTATPHCHYRAGAPPARTRTNRLRHAPVLTRSRMILQPLVNHVCSISHCNYGLFRHGFDIRNCAFRFLKPAARIGTRFYGTPTPKDSYATAPRVGPFITDSRISSTTRIQSSVVTIQLDQSPTNCGLVRHARSTLCQENRRQFARTGFAGSRRSNGWSRKKASSTGMHSKSAKSAGQKLIGIAPRQAG